MEMLEKEVKELNEQFVEFLHTKGIKAKFSLAFQNMKQSASAQHQVSVQNFNEVKEKSIQDNKEFYEFLHTKGFKAKVKLVIENIKKGISEANERTKEQIQKSKQLSKPHVVNHVDLTNEFNEFLKLKGLENKYKVTIEEIK